MINKLFIFFLLFAIATSSGTYSKKEIDSQADNRRPPEAARTETLTVPQIIIPEQRETQSLKEEVIKLRSELAEQKTILNAQKELTSNLLERIIEVVTTQNTIIGSIRDNINILNDFSKFSMAFFDQGLTFKDAFILSKDGKPYAFIDNGLRLYEYNGGNFLGWIKPETNEIIRNFDNSIVAVIENDFVIDETGHPIGSIERSETLRWDREKLSAKIQKTPVSHFFVRPQSPRQFILAQYRSSDWSTQKIEDVLFFLDSKIQKLK